MISTIMKISLLNLRRDKVAFSMTFVLPVVFFSIFAMIFGASNRSVRENQIHVVVVDNDQTEISHRFVETIRKQKVLNVANASDESLARQQVHDGKFPVAVVVLKGFSETFGDFRSPSESIELVYDAANPLAENAVGGLLQAAAMMSAPDILIEKGFSSMEPLGAGLTAQQKEALNDLRPYMRGETNRDAMQGMLRIRSTDVRAGDTPDAQRSMVAYYAAGVSVMFLLFSMAAAGGALLDETDSGTLERLISTRASMTQVLTAKWLFLSLVGLAQVTVMFLWAAAIFHLELFTPAHLAGFAAMATATAAAASAFGLVLGSACKTRAQLSGISTIVILIMSALGGSMVPHFLMPRFIATTALFTFNGWALDGFLKVFWYGESSATAMSSVVSVAPQVAMLTGLAAAFLAIARTLARRWETV
jgi:linearmycin/streptolysin S transport system permease protein